MALHCQGGGTPLPSLKKSLAHEKYFWRGLEEKKISRYNDYYSG
jgi:hypothetical protein